MATIEQDTLDSEITALVADKLGYSADELTLHTHIVDELDADSLDVAEIVMDIEERYLIEVGDDDMEKLTTISAIADYVRKHKAKNG